MSLSEPARTFFIVIHEKSLEKMGIEYGEWEDLESIKEQLNKYYSERIPFKSSHYTAICTSKEGKKHIHEVMTALDGKKRRPGAIAKLYGDAHSEVMGGSKKEAEDYINKRGKFEEKGETIDLIWGDIETIEDNRGTRTDIKKFDKMTEAENFNLDEFLLTMDSQRLIKLYEDRYYRLKRVQAQKWRDIEVFYVEGNAGSGKTSGVYERHEKLFKTSVDIKNNFPFNGYRCEDILVLDELRPGIFSHGELMQILDGYPLYVNIKGGIATACWTKVYITTAFPLKEWYKGDYMKEDYKQQFLRRINHHYIAKNKKWYDYETGEEIK